MKIDNYEVTPLGKSSWRIEGGIARAFLFAGSSRAMLIDSTDGHGNLVAVISALTSLPILLVNTHADADHISCNHQFTQTYMHPAEFAYYAEMAKPGYAQPMPLQDGQLINLGGQCFEVILLPGHTYGSIALLDRENRFLVAGDSVSSTPVFIFGRMRSIAALQVSLNRLKSRLEEFDVIYSSHGDFPIGKGQIDNELSCARKLLAGSLTPQEPPFPMPAKMYLWDGAGFYYNSGN